MKFKLIDGDRDCVRAPRKFLLCTGVAAVFLVACNAPDAGPTAPTGALKPDAASDAAVVSSAALDYGTPILARGQALQLQPTLRDGSGNVLHPRSLQWKSADPSIVKVDPAGLTGDLVAVSPGITTITGTTEGVNVTSVVTVVGFAVLSPGEFVTCAITTAGKLYCAGRDYGPAAQRVAPSIHFASVSVTNGGFGDTEACALDADNHAYCWGTDNTSGQLGVGDFDVRSTPTAVVGGISFGSISVGRDYACGVATNGDAYCWGNGSTGQLGTGAKGNSSAPVAVQGGLKFSQLEAGNGTTCGLTPSGKAYCWGRNDLGQLGGGTNGGQSTTPQAVGDPLATTVLKQIVTRGPKTCGLTMAGRAYCWGNNTVKEVGAVTTEICGGGKPCSSTPIPVQTSAVFSSLAASQFATCGVTSTYQTLCWGMDFEYLFGSRPPDRIKSCDTFGAPNACTIVPTNGPSGMLKLAGSRANYCGTKSDAVWYCWGGNDFGQRGWGDATADPSPQPFSIAPGAAH